MSKVVFNGAILNNSPTGLGVYTKNLLENINSNVYDYVLFTDNFNQEKSKVKSNIVLKVASKNKIKSVFLRNYVVKDWLKKHKNEDLLHYSPTQHGSKTKGIKQIITIHDLMPLFYPKGRMQQYFYYKIILKKIIKNSNLIITCSNNTKKDIVKYYNVDPNKIKVIYNGFDKPSCSVNKKKSSEEINTKYGIKDYIFMMGIHYEYKNLHSVIEVYDQVKDEVKESLVIAGGYNGEYGKYLRKLVKDKGLEDRVKFLGYVPDEDKEKLYQASKIFVYPSKYEGFGLPVLEAMANETVVVSSNSSSLPEVLGDAAIKFDPNDLKDVKRAILKAINLSNSEYNSYVDKGLDQIKLFSWEKCALQVQHEIMRIKQEEIVNE